MAGWTDGYVTDVTYTVQAYRELAPSWLSFATLAMGQLPPDLSRPFRYAELGCGYGMSALIIAATCPHAEVWAFDFNPSHIEAARRLADQAGLTNIHFEEASFAEIAALPPNGLPPFDFIAAHGVLSWVSEENRRALVQIIGQRLRPGGLAYLSYNVLAGWASFMPLRTLMRELQRSYPASTAESVAGVLEYLDLLKQTDCLYLKANPAVVTRLDDLGKQDRRYLAHEYLNQNWHPLTFAEVSASMAEAKCQFVASAMLTDNMAATSVTAGMMTLFNEAPDPVLRETLRDLGLGQMFRRDIYRRGAAPQTAFEQQRLIDETELTWTGLVPPDPIELTASFGKVTGVPDFYRSLMGVLMDGDRRIGDLRATHTLAKWPPAEILQAVLLLMTSDYLLPVLPASVRANSIVSTVKLNAALTDRAAEGAEIYRVASALTGQGVAVDPIGMLVLREKLLGHSMDIEGVTDRVLATLSQTGRAVQHDGVPVTNYEEAKAVVRNAATAILDRQIPLLQRMGCVG